MTKNQPNHRNRAPYPRRPLGDLRRLAALPVLLLLLAPALQAQDEVLLPAPVVPAPAPPAPTPPAPQPTPAPGVPPAPVVPGPVVPAPPPPTIEPPMMRRSAKRLAAGVELIQEITPAGMPGGPLLVTALRIDRNAPGVRIEAALGQDRVWGTDATLGRETVSSMVRRRGALAGINAGYFPFAGIPIGLHIGGGDLVTEPNARTVFSLLTGNRARLDTFTFEGFARGATNVPLRIHGINRRPGKGNELLLYTPRFFSSTLPAPGRFEVLLTGVKGPMRAGVDYSGIVAEMRDGGGLPLAEGNVVLSGGGASAEFLRAAARAGTPFLFRLEIGTRSGASLDVSSIREAVAGGPRLLTDGRVTVNGQEEGFAADFVSGRHPRTAAAITAVGDLLLVAVDGRNPALSRGASLAELAQILLKLGARDAVNLDGGGSTALAVRGAVTNAPSDGSERPVANALLVFADAGAAGAARPLSLNGPLQPVMVGQNYSLSLTDAAGSPLASHPGVTWGTTGGIGFVTQEGVFRALRSGYGTVQAAIGSEVLTVPVSVQPKPAPAAAALRPGGNTPAPVEPVGSVRVP